jgi:hypothetical protein
MWWWPLLLAGFIVSLGLGFALGSWSEWFPRAKSRPCPICDGRGTTNLMSSGGAPQRCGICRGTGLHPGRLM